MTKSSLAVGNPESVEVDTANQPEEAHAFRFHSTRMIEGACDRLSPLADAPSDDLVEHLLCPRVGDLEEADKRRLEIVMECASSTLFSER